MNSKDKCPECKFEPFFTTDKEKDDYKECVWCGCDLTKEIKKTNDINNDNN